MESVSIMGDSPPVKLGKNKNVKRVMLLILALYLAFLVYIFFYALQSYAIEVDNSISVNEVEKYFQGS